MQKFRSHGEVLIDRMVMWLEMYDGNMDKAKYGLGRYGVYAIDELWQVALKRWKVKHKIDVKKKRRLEKMKVTVNMVGRAVGVTVTNGRKVVTV